MAKSRLFMVGEPHFLRFADQGQVLITNEGFDTVSFRGWPDPEPKHTALDGNHHHVSAVAFSPDGTTLVAAGWDGRIDAQTPGIVRLWNATDQRLEKEFPRLTHAVHDVAWSIDGTTIVTGGGDWDRPGEPGEVHVWDAATRTRRLSLTGLTNCVTGVAISPDGETIATGGRVRLFDSSTGHEKSASPMDSTWAYGVAFSSDGATLATCGGDWREGQQTGIIELWNTSDGWRIGRLDGHSNVVYRVRFSRDGRSLVSASWDGTAVVWDVEQRSQLCVLQGQFGSMSGAEFTPDGRHVLTVGDDGWLIRWNALDGSMVDREWIRGGSNVAPRSDGFRHSLALSHNGKMAALGTWGNLVKLFDAESLDAATARIQLNRTAEGFEVGRRQPRSHLAGDRPVVQSVRNVQHGDVSLALVARRE